MFVVGAVFMWISVVLGTVLGLLFGFMAGAGKLFPFHPTNHRLVFAFDKVYGPFFGCAGWVLRVLIGIGELVGGIGLLVGLWGDALGLYGESVSDLASSLCIVAGVALMTTSLAAGAMHTYVDGSPGCPAGLGIAAMVFVLIRVFTVEPQTRAHQMLCTWLSLPFLVGALVAVFVNRANGVHESEVQQANTALQQMP
mmetsp:Transcript_105219/g.297378  ORF Transcript_105219/g.297378 Transcript_105219/m.297378 type:complete len:197 (-) Transcript_105219:190-780(-)